MSQVSTEAVQVKVEPLYTEDDIMIEPENERQACHVHHEEKEEADWNIDTYLLKSQGRTLRNDYMCDINPQAIHILHIENDAGGETIQSSEVGDKASWYTINHMVKVEREADVSGVSETATQDDIFKGKSQIKSTNHRIIKECENEANIANTKKVVVPSGLYVEHVVSIKREADDFEVNNTDTQSDLLSKTSQLQNNAIKASHNNNLIKEEYQNDISMRDAESSTSLYLDHKVKLEKQANDFGMSKTVTSNTSLVQNVIKEEQDKEASMFRNETAIPNSLFKNHEVKLERENGSAIRRTESIADDVKVGRETEGIAIRKAKSIEEREVNPMQDNNTNLQSGKCGSIVKEEGSASPLDNLYLDHLVKEELVVGPEVLHRANGQASHHRMQRGLITGRNCSVRLENMHVDMKHGFCRIGRNTYKFRPHLQSYKGTLQNKRKSKKKDNQDKPYKCEYCDYATTKKHRLTVHGKRHSSDRPFKCNFCNYATAYKAHLEIHERTHMGDKPYKCEHCDYATAVKHRLTTHGKIHSSDRPFKCSLCNYATAYKAHLEIHERTHSSDKPYKCDRCSYACIQKCDLLVHQRIHSGEKPHKCKHCDFACNRKRDLLLHERTHTGEKPFKCEHCDYASIRKRDLLVHARTHAVLSSLEVGETIYKCEHCNYSTGRKHDWMMHERRLHKSDKPFKCDQCNYAVACKASLLKHVKKHTGEQVEKRFQCTHCDYSSDHKNHMLVHQRKHTGEKPYKCRYCVYATAYRRDLLVHEALHAGDNPYKCSQCYYACGNVSKLRIHEKIHSDENANKPDVNVSISSEDNCNSNDNTNTKLIHLTETFQL